MPLNFVALEAAFLCTPEMRLYLAVQPHQVSQSP